MLGFKGSGQNYELPSPDYWAMLGFQKSAFSDSRELSFTLNVLVVSRQVWEQMRAERSDLRPRPTATTYWGDFCWQHRIGELLPGEHRDLWWDLSEQTDVSALTDAVLWAIRDYLLPAMREQMMRTSTQGS
jgi:Domain of unknown function (DUF4304)